MPFEGGQALLIGVGSHTYAPYLDVPIDIEKLDEDVWICKINQSFRIITPNSG